MSTTRTVSESFPVGLHHAFWFSAFNALSFQIILGSPMVLYAKSLGASATVLGIVAGMMPLLVIFQIPAASHISRIGFKRFVYAGWGARVMFIFALAVVPLTARFLDESNRLAVLLGLLFCFNLSRGISSCAWLPWITALVPETLRGKYLARDAATQSLASCGAFLVSALSLRGEAQPWQFAVLFAFSAVMGAISLSFLKRIPDVQIPVEAAAGTGRVPWLEMTRYAPFRKLLHTVIAWSVAYGGLVAFTTAFLKVKAGMPDSEIMLVSALSYLGGLSSLWLLGSRLDRLGSKPVMKFSFAGWIVVLLGWTLLAGQVFPANLATVLPLQFLMGLLVALVNMATTRLAMAVVPAMGRNHFFALFSVLTNVTLGLAPVGWGLLIDAVGAHEWRALGVDWNRFTIFYAAAAVVFALTLWLARSLEEPKAASLEQLLRDILGSSPLRFWLRLWPRG
jgi:MFS family permease